MRIAPVAGETLTAKSWNHRYGLLLRRTAAQSVTSSTVKVGDDVFMVPLEANAVYYVSMVLGTTGAEAGNLAINWTLPSGATGYRQCLGPASGMTNPASTGASAPVRPWTQTTTYGTDPIEACILETGNIATISAGVMQMQWAQGTSDATATTIAADSYLIVERVS